MSTMSAGPRTLTQMARWQVDPARSEIRLLGYYGEMPWVNGVLKGVSGELLLDFETPAGSTFELLIDAAGLYVGDPFLNTKLRAADLLGGDGSERRLSGRISAPLGAGEHEAEVQHTLARVACPLLMAVKLSRWQAVGDPAQGSSPPSRLNLSARQLSELLPAPGAPRRVLGARRQGRWVEQICLDLEALPGDTGPPAGA